MSEISDSFEAGDEALRPKFEKIYSQGAGKFACDEQIVEWHDPEPQPPEGMTKVDFKCSACGVDFPLYHDGETAGTFSVICRCGERNTWSFTPPPDCSRYQGIGIKMDGLVSGNIEMFRA